MVASSTAGPAGNNKLQDQIEAVWISQQSIKQAIDDDEA